MIVNQVYFNEKAAKNFSILIFCDLLLNYISPSDTLCSTLTKVNLKNLLHVSVENYMIFIRLSGCQIQVKFIVFEIFSNFP